MNQNDDTPEGTRPTSLSRVGVPGSMILPPTGRDWSGSLQGGLWTPTGSEGLQVSV